MSDNRIDARATPPAREGTVTVSREAFFATVGQLNVHSHIRTGYDRVHGFRSEWTYVSISREVIGYSYLGTYQSNGRFMVTSAYFNRNREKIESAEKANDAKRAVPHAVAVLGANESGAEFQARCAVMRREAMLALDVGNDGVIPAGGGPYAGCVVRLANATELGLTSDTRWREDCPYLPSDVCVLASWPFEMDSREMHPFDRERLEVMVAAERARQAQTDESLGTEDAGRERMRAA